MFYLLKEHFNDCHKYASCSSYAICKLLHTKRRYYFIKLIDDAKIISVSDSISYYILVEMSRI